MSSSKKVIPSGVIKAPVKGSDLPSVYSPLLRNPLATRDFADL